MWRRSALCLRRPGSATAFAPSLSAAAATTTTAFASRSLRCHPHISASARQARHNSALSGTGDPLTSPEFEEVAFATKQDRDLFVREVMLADSEGRVVHLFPAPFVAPKSFWRRVIPRAREMDLLLVGEIMGDTQQVPRERLGLALLGSDAEEGGGEEQRDDAAVADTLHPMPNFNVELADDNVTIVPLVPLNPLGSLKFFLRRGASFKKAERDAVAKVIEVLDSPATHNDKVENCMILFDPIGLDVIHKTLLDRGFTELATESYYFSKLLDPPGAGCTQDERLRHHLVHIMYVKLFNADVYRGQPSSGVVQLGGILLLLFGGWVAYSLSVYAREAYTEYTTPQGFYTPPRHQHAPVPSSGPPPHPSSSSS